MTKLTRPSLSPLKADHFFSISETSDQDLITLLTLADYYAALMQSGSDIPRVLTGRTQVNVFFENSTRTNSSFELAGKKLGADVLVVPVAASSVHKGEALLDTVQTLAALNTDAMIIRHKDAGSCKAASAALGAAGLSTCKILNAGEGTADHPSQALLDALTMFQSLGRTPDQGLHDIKIAICGDIRHSRVASSNAQLLPRLGAELRFVGPEALLPPEESYPEIDRYISLEDGIQDADFVMALRIQFERLPDGLALSKEDFFQAHGLTHERLAPAPKAFVMHPGPMNRGVEISGALADDLQRSLVLKQVQNGVAVRMALLDAFLHVGHNSP